MVCFRDITESGNTYLLILNYEKQSVEKGTRLRVHKTLNAPFSPEWPKFTNPLRRTSWTREVAFSKTSSAWILESSHHRATNEASPLLTLGHRIAAGDAKWGDNVEFAGEFRFFKGYWEWTEDVLSRCGNELRLAGIYDSVYASLFTYDRNIEVVKAFCEAWCPATNTLLISPGELSISLWDLHILSGLPARGSLYEEVVPCTEELLGVDKEGKFYVPSTCMVLFHAYHYIQSNQSGPVTIEDWIKFWCRKSLVYKKPPPRKEKKTMRPPSTHNPTGDLKAHGAWHDLEMIPFTILQLKEKYRAESYLAGYIACWLCVFVLPDGDANLIRPNTFKMASLMASQRKVALTVPVLASIYRGLNNISNSLDLSQAFPIHFVYSWLAHYFKTHFLFDRKIHAPRMVQYSGEGGARYLEPADARRRLYRGDKISWNCTMFADEDNKHFIDTNDASESEQCFFMAIRSNYLVRRIDKYWIVEPYSPHRFSRQFGFYQNIPGVISQDLRQVPLEDGLKYWRICMLRRTMSKVCFPSLISSPKKFSSPEYRNWWDQTYNNYLEENILIHLKSDKTSKKGVKVDASGGEIAKADKKGEKVDHPTGDASKSKKKGKKITPDGEISKANEKGGKVNSHEDRIPKSQEKFGEANSPKDGTSKGQKNVEDAAPSSEKRKTSMCLIDDSTSSNGDHHFKRPKKNAKSAGSSAHCANTSTDELEREIFGTNDLDGFQDLEDSSEFAKSSEPQQSDVSVKVKSTTHQVAVSEFNSKDVFDKHRKICLQNCWREIREKIMRTPPEFISAIQEEALGGFLQMKSFSGDLDMSHLELSLNELFTNAAAYDKARSSSFEAEELVIQRMEKIKSCISVASVKDIGEVDQIKSIEGELAELEARRKTLLVSLKEHKKSHEAFQNEIKGFEEELVKLKSSSESEASNKVKSSRSLLESAQKALEDQAPFA